MIRTPNDAFASSSLFEEAELAGAAESSLAGGPLVNQPNRPITQAAQRALPTLPFFSIMVGIEKVVDGGETSPRFENPKPPACRAKDRLWRCVAGSS